MSKVAVIRSDGKQGYVPVNRLGDALSKGGFQLANPSQKISVVNPQGKSGFIPANRLLDALNKGGFQLGEQLQESPSFLERAKQFGQGALSGIGRAAFDEASGQSNAGVMDVGGGAIPISTASSMANIPRQGVNALESLRPSADDSLGKILYGAGEFGAGVASFPTSPGTGNLARMAGNIGRNAAMGSAIGATSGSAQELGANPLAADLAASVIVPSAAKPQNLLSAFQKTKQLPAKLAMKTMGLTPNKLDLKTAHAARDLGIDLPAAALTDSSITNDATYLVKKAPFFKSKLKKKEINAKDQTLRAIDDIYDQTGPLNTKETQAIKTDMYGMSDKLLPENSRMKPLSTIEAINNAKTKINSSLYKSKQDKQFLKEISEMSGELLPETETVGRIGGEKISLLNNGKFGGIKIPSQNLAQDVDIARLIEAKQKLNQSIKWDTPDNLKNAIKDVRAALVNDLKEYGKTNPEWYKAYKQADKYTGDMAKRGKLEKLITDKSIDKDTGVLSFNKLSKAINNANSSSRIKKQVTPEIYEKIEKLGTVAKAMAIKNKNTSSISGKTTTAATLALIYGVATNPFALLSGSGIGAAIGAQAGSHLLTDKKFLDLAIKLAENPNKTNILTVTALNKKIKDATGYSAVALNRELQRQQGEGN